MTKADCKSRISLALQMIYGMRLATDVSRWTDEQVKLIQGIEADLVKLRNSIGES